MMLSTFLIACFSYMAVREVCGCPMIFPLIIMILLKGHFVHVTQGTKLCQDAEGEGELNEAVVKCGMAHCTVYPVLQSNSTEN